MKTYRICTYEVVDGQQGPLVDIVEFKSTLDISHGGKNVFHLIEAASADMADASIPSDPLYGQRMDSADLGEN